MGNKKPELVACPWCGAKPGEHCFTEHKGQRYPLSVRAHASRYEALKTTKNGEKQMKPTEHLTITERPGTYITVMSDSSGPIIVVSDGPGARASRYTPEEAAKLGLAILEAAGVTETDSPYMQEAADNLRAYILIEEKVTAEAREREELEAEALELHNAFWDGWDRNRIDSWDDQPGKAKNAWVSAARRAREMRAEK